MTRKEKTTLIALGSVTAVLLIVAIILLAVNFTSPADDGKILKGVVAAGVNLGGLTQEQATIALEKATANTYTKLDMVVNVVDTTITLSPEKTGAKLDIQAVVEDAYNYGRTGSRSERNQAKNNALANSVIIPITPHLNLDTAYIRNELSKLGTQFSSTLSQPTFRLTGTKPTMDLTEKPDTNRVYQNLSIYVGTAEYGLDTNKLYEQVMEYYNINIFHVEGVCTVVAPDSIDEQLQSYYDELCVAPIDAKMDPETYEVTPEVYGYGFILEEVKELIAETPYGQTVNIPLRYLAPTLTEELISSNLFKDVIGTHSAILGADEAWNQNVNAACQALNGLVINSGDTFSFNAILGELTAENGYTEALAYRNRVHAEIMGGGITQAASLLYISALEAELEIVERHSHAYAPDFIEKGLDAYVDSKADLSFRNNRPDPIRIKAEVIEGTVVVSIEGTDSRNYTVDLRVKVTDTIAPGTLYNVMVSGNPAGFVNGEVLAEGAEGYVLEVYKSMYDKETGLLQNETFVCTFSYDALDAIVVRLQSA